MGRGLAGGAPCGGARPGVVARGGSLGGKGDSVEVRAERGTGLNGGVTEVTVDGTRNAVAEAQGGGNVTVGFSVAEATAAVAGLGDGRTGALAGVEGATALLTVGVPSTGTCDELVTTAREGIARGEIVGLHAVGGCKKEGKKFDREGRQGR